MAYTPNEIIEISLNPQEHNIARQFALEQDTPQKGKQVYLNTLAILAIHDFLEWLGIESDLETSDSWNPAVRCFHDVADLVIPDLGKIECRPILPKESVVSLPIEVTEDRIAYIAVQFQEQLNEVQLLGFCPATIPQPQEIEIANLQPIETLIDYIDRLESAQLEPKVTNIGTWWLPELADLNLEAIHDNTWQKLDDFINSLAGNQSPRFVMGLRSSGSSGYLGISRTYIKSGKGFTLIGRSGSYLFIRLPPQTQKSRSSSPNPELPSESVRKAKEIDLGQNQMALIINCQQKIDEKTYIFIRLYPFLAEEIYLPSGIAIIILDESGNIFSEVQAGSKNKMLEVREFRGKTGERFTIKVALGNINYTENFVI